MSHTVVGLFKSTADAQRAVSDLKDRGFASSAIDMSTGNVGTVGSTSGIGASDYNSGSTTGTGYGASTVGTTTENEGEGFGDSIGRFFKNLFGGDEADTYSNVARRSDAIVTVHAVTVDLATQAVEILDAAGAVDAHEEDANLRSGISGSTYGSTGVNTGAGAAGTAKVIREDLEVGKREVETGGVRLRSRIVERPVEESIRLRSEHVTVVRTPVNRPASETDFQTFKEGNVELTETREVPVVAKTAQVIEEVSLGKQTTEHTETIKGTVRNTEVDVEKIPGRDASLGSDLTNNI